MEPAPTRRTYGNWRLPAVPGLWRLGLAPTVCLGVVGFTALIVFNLTGLAPTLVFLVVALPPFALLVKPRAGGNTRLEDYAARAAGARARWRGEALYRSGPLGLVPCGTHRLPGLLAASELSQAQDAHGRLFAVLAHPHVRHLTVVLESEPDGATLADQAQVDQWVAHFGDWKARLSREPGLIAAQISIESSPDPGTRLAHMLDGRRSGSAPQYADEVVGDLRAENSSGAAQLQARIALIYRTYAPGGRRLPIAEKAQEIGLRLPNLTAGLACTGAGVAVPVDAQRLCEVVHAAYHPHAANKLEATAGVGRPTLSWVDIGPVSAEAASTCYRHEGAVSVTWEMSEPPRSGVYETVLAELLAPHPAIPRKRVTLLYRVLSPAESARMVDDDLKQAAFGVTSKKRATYRDHQELDAAKATAAAEALGSPVIDFGMLVTATALDEAALSDVVTAVEYAAPSARVELRVVIDSQDSAFAAALPCGVWLPEYKRIPESYRRMF